MKYYNMPLDLFGWANSEIGIFGGWRYPTLHPPGKLVCSFGVYDTKAKRETGNDKQVGSVRLLIKLPTEEGGQCEIESLIELEIDKKFRKNGYGRKAVAAIHEAAKQDVKIVDITKSKVAFWKKVGAEDIKTERTNIYGWLRKEPELTPAPAI
jgi:GNAT superfamily N-acetyltransferase